MYFPLILWSFGLKLDLYGCPGAWDHFNPVRTPLSLKLPQKQRQNVEYCAGNEPQSFGKMDVKISVKNLACLLGLGETVQDKMAVMTLGSFHVFT